MAINPQQQQQQQQQLLAAVNHVLSQIAFNDDDRWRALSTELQRYQNHLEQQQQIERKERPRKPPLRLGKTDRLASKSPLASSSRSPLLKLLIRLPQQTQTREIVIYEESKHHIAKSVDEFCREMNSDRYKREIRQCIAQLIFEQD